MSRRSGSVVELLGPPGAGKSVLAQALAAAGVAVVDQHSRYLVSAAAFAGPRALNGMLSRPPVGVTRKQWAGWAARLAIAPRTAQHHLVRGATTVVFDQGAAYSLARMLCVRQQPAGNAWWWRRSVEVAEVLDLLVLLDADPATLLQRARDRHPQHRDVGLSPASWQVHLEQQRTACHLVADVLAREGSTTHRLVTTGLTVAEEVEIVMQSLNRRGRRLGVDAISSSRLPQPTESTAH